LLNACNVKAYIYKLASKFSIGEGKCLLDILLSIKDEEGNASFTPKELQYHIMTFLIAGHETLHALANNFDVQERLRQKIVLCRVQNICLFQIKWKKIAFLFICHSAVKKVIDEKLEKTVTGEGKCLLDILLSIKDEEGNASFTPKELQYHIMTFLIAGHEAASKN
ncbi:hypothetical protein TrispH2_011684, partial [Trichoplax sp. H2]